MEKIKNEDWIIAQEKIYKNLHLDYDPKTCGKALKNQESFKDSLFNQFSSGLEIKKDDIIYTGHLYIKEKEYVGIYFRIDELKDDNKKIYDYHSSDINRRGCIPYLKLLKKHHLNIPIDILEEINGKLEIN